ncbi:hypothetical protein ACIHFD_04555 [Nonomuraea sp. NPDC051941]|uniref:hypothetical protein n=1 Tax=Nonomuraea sp. NPDC051941 TaxID=3364373 RepID=UPI0037CB61BD
MTMANTFVARDRAELARRYGAFYARRVPLDEDHAPANLRALVPYAEIWGIGDDVDRDNLVESSPPEAREDLRELNETYWREFNDWLAGPEADAKSYSREYIAFSNLRMAAGYLRALDIPDDQKE